MEGTPCEVGGESGACSADGSCIIPTGPTIVRALAVVADFADAVLEDYTGDGFTSEGEIREALDGMEAHWAWMSQGGEIMEWDLLRVTLPNELTEFAYPSWQSFRDTVVELASQQTDFSDYDSNNDGVLDAMFIIASSAELAYPYLTGGMARAGDALTFVDGQGSLSVRVRAIGNFNHEVGHCRGLPDLYGDYATLHYLTLMHDSWPVPPTGFSAYDRMRLGWIQPTQIFETTTDVRLTTAESSSAALRVSGMRPSEYFLIEYRKRADEGYGSSAEVEYDGLAVYHVFEQSSQSVNPPRVLLVAADQQSEPNVPPEATDFLFPENDAMVEPFEVRSHFAADPLFRIRNLRRVDQSIAFDVVLLATPAETPREDLLLNGSFEEGAGPDPDAWSHAAWQPDLASFSWEEGEAWDGTRHVRIAIPQESLNDARWTQELTGLSTDTGYLLCGWLKGESIESEANRIGASVSVMSPSAHSEEVAVGTFDWSERCVAFMPLGDGAIVGCRLGYFGSTAFGQLWCDALSLTALPSAF